MVCLLYDWTGSPKTRKVTPWLPNVVRMKVHKRTYHSTRAQLREEVDMLGLSLEEARKAFARPFKFDSD